MNINSRKFAVVFYLFMISILINTSAMAGTDTIKISCAANLSDALKKIGEHFSKNRPGIEIQYNFGSSGSLAKQIDRKSVV
jgi:ABC-type molybdate transport system substrate-binding protein